MRKRLLTIIAICLLVIPLVSCRSFWNEAMEPSGQENTKWVSEDGNISFFVEKRHEDAFGEMVIDGETIEFAMMNDMGSGMYFRTLDAAAGPVFSMEEGLYVYFTCVYLSKDKFIATVKKSTYLPIGEKIVFYKQ